MWLHLDRTDADAERWLCSDSGLAPVAVDASRQEETRPRYSVLPDGLLVIRRGVNLNPGAKPEGMMSSRV